jgi:hypothetical protein
VLQREENAFQVGIDLRIPDCFGQFDRPAGSRTAHIIDQHVDAAEMLKAGLHHDFDRGGVGDIALVRDDFATHRLHALDGLCNAVQLAVDCKYPGAFFRKAHGGGAPVAPAGADAACAGDDRNASLQTLAHVYAPVSLRAAAKR